MTLIFFFGGGGGWRGEMENCAYLRKNPGYAPGFTFWRLASPKEKHKAGDPLTQRSALEAP